MDYTKSIRIQIESLLVDLWVEGRRIGSEAQKEEDNTTLEEKVIDAYERGYNKGFEQGRASASKR